MEANSSEAEVHSRSRCYYIVIEICKHIFINKGWMNELYGKLQSNCFLCLLPFLLFSFNPGSLDKRKPSIAYWAVSITFCNFNLKEKNYESNTRVKIYCVQVLAKAFVVLKGKSDMRYKTDLFSFKLRETRFNGVS